MQDPLRFVNIDPAYTRTLLDQRAAGKKLVVITNSDWVYTSTMMHATYAPFLPPGMGWRDLFDIIIVSACKPDFFGTARRPVYKVASDDGMLRETYRYEEGVIPNPNPNPSPSPNPSPNLGPNANPNPRCGSLPGSTASPTPSWPNRPSA